MSQDYYWTPEWQADERESLAELERGEGLTFESASAATVWLSAIDENGGTE